MAKKNVSKLALTRETLVQLTATELDGAAGGYATGACDNQSYGFLCGELCGNSKSCQPK